MSAEPSRAVLAARDIGVAAGAAGHAALTVIGLVGTAFALYNLRRNQIGPGGEPVREPASWALMLIVAFLLLLAVFALSRTPRVVRAAVVTQGVTAAATGVILIASLVVSAWVGHFGAFAVWVIAAAVVCAVAAVTAVMVRRANLRRASVDHPRDLRRGMMDP